MRPLIGLIFLLLLAAGSLFASSQSDDDSDDEGGVTNDLSEESDEMNSECEDSALDLEEDHEAVSKQIRRCYEKLQGESWDLWSIPETYTPWIQNAGCGLEIVSADYGSVGGTGRSEQLSRIGGAEQSGTTTESNRKNVGANFSFARAHPPPPEEECRYTLQKDFIWLPANKYNTVRLRATFKATLKHESCVGDHSAQLTIRVRYLRTSYVSPTEAIALLPEHPSQQDFAGDDGEALEKFIKNAEESAHISFDTVLSTDVPTSTISVQETIPFSENLRSANLELMLITKCPEAIEVGNSQLLLFTQYSAQEDIGLSDLHLVPRALLPDNLYRRITTRLGEHIIQRTLSDDSQYVTSFQVQSESGGSIPDVTFYIIPRQKQSGDGTWRIQFGAIAYVNYQSSVKITLSCPTMVTQLHLQNVDQQHLVIQRYETMTGSYHDQHRPDENACDQVLVRITFPRRLSAPSVEKLFFICDNEPCEYKPVVATERRAGPGPVPRLPSTSTGGTGRSQTLRSPVQPGSPESEHYRRARECGRVTASGTHTSQSALHRGKYTRKLRLAIGLGVALSLSVLLICCITALIVFFRSRRVSSHPWRYASKHAKHTRTHRTSEVEEIEFLDFKPHQSQVHPLDSNKANAGIFDSVALDFTAEI